MRFIVLFVVLVLTSFFAPPVQADAATWQELLTNADSLIQAQLADSAVIITRLAVARASRESTLSDSLRASFDERLGRALCSAAHYNEAEPYLRHALDVQQKLFGLEHPDVAQTLQDLAWVKLRQSKLAFAEYLAREALAIREQNPKTTQLQLASSYEGLATICSYTKSKLPETERLLKRALSLRQQQPGACPVDWAGTTYSLALLYRVWDQVPRADTIFRQLLSIYQATYGPEDLRVGKTLGNIGNLNLYLGNLQVAEEYLRRALEVDLKHLPEVHPTIASICFTMGATLASENRLDESEQYVRRALKIWQATSGPSHPDAAGALEELAGLLTRRGKYEESTTLLVQALTIRRQEFRENYYLLPEHEAVEYSNKLRQSLSDYLACYFKISDPSPTLTDAACSWMLNCKGELSEAMYVRARRLHAPSDSATGKIADSIATVRQQLAAGYARDDDPERRLMRPALDSLEQLLTQLESSFARQSAAADSLSRPTEWCVEEAHRLLPDSSALVEFMQYGGYNGGHVADSTLCYAAAVISKSGNELINLGPAYEIDTSIRQYQEAANSAFLTPEASGSKVPATPAELLRTLCQKIWKPVEPYIGSDPTVLIAPDGAINNVSFATLMEGDEYLIESHCLRYLSASRDLRKLESVSQTRTGLLALGDPDYDAPAEVRIRAIGTSRSTPTVSGGNSAPFALRNARSDCQYFHEVTLPSLPYTRREIDDIGACWRSQFREPVELLYRSAASEENFKRDVVGKRVIHIATHGFFRPGNCSGASSGGDDLSTDEPLLSSGLFLAGSNLHGAGADMPGAEDGILTAMEVSCLDLRGTELVVLSACQSGLGTIQAGEGVYGLRRAFQMAGAHRVVSALWKIPDRETGRLMTSLYSHGWTNVAKALQTMALQQIKQQRSMKQPQNPFVWGSFTAVGE